MKEVTPEYVIQLCNSVVQHDDRFGSVRILFCSILLVSVNHDTGDDDDEDDTDSDEGDKDHGAWMFMRMVAIILTMTIGRTRR